MKTSEEIQRAHDMLMAVLLEEVPAALTPKARQALHVSCDVLCWVLEHDHNDSFAANLEDLERMLARQGWFLERKDN